MEWWFYGDEQFSNEMRKTEEEREKERGGERRPNKDPNLTREGERRTTANETRARKGSRDSGSSSAGVTAILARPPAALLPTTPDDLTN